MLAARAARRWLARYAAGVKLIRSRAEAAAWACLSLVSCLPALEDVELCLPASLDSEELSCLLEALAWCPRLKALDLRVTDHEGDDVPQPIMVGCAPAFAKLRSLTSLALSFGGGDPLQSADAPHFGSGLAYVVHALVSLTV